MARRKTKWTSEGVTRLQPKEIVQPGGVDGKLAEEINKVVVFFDICSSSKILEHLMLKDQFDDYLKLLIGVKNFLYREKSQVGFEVYKFIGDGWVLLFPADIDGHRLVAFLAELSEFYEKALNRLPGLLDNPPDVRGLTFGVEKGKLHKVVMADHDEYIGRPLNLAAML